MKKLGIILGVVAVIWRFSSNPRRRRRRQLQPSGQTFAGSGQPMGAGAKRISTPRGFDSESRFHRFRRGQFREIHADGNHPGPRVRRSGEN